MRKIVLSISIIVLTLTAKAQNEKYELITDRPDQTESSVVVPHKYLQIETGFVMENSSTNLFSKKSFAYNSTLLRYGLLVNFELRLGLEYLGEKSNMENNIKTDMSGLSPLYMGFKVKIADEDGWKPEFAFLGGLVLPLTANDNFKPSYTAADIRFAFSHTLSDRFSLGYNLGAEWDGETAIPSYFYSVSLGAAITDNIGMFVESYGWLRESGAKHLLDAGFTYLLLPNFQLDISGGIGIQNSIDNFISLGMTYRFSD